MREIGSLSTEQSARRFTDYLLTRGIQSKPEAEGEKFCIWILDEDQVEAAKAELRQFREEPEAKRYRAAASAARDLRDATIKAERQRQRERNRVDARPPWQLPVYKRFPATTLLILLSGIVSAITYFGTTYDNGGSWLTMIRMEDSSQPGMISTPEGHDLRVFQTGQVWRLVTPIFLHLSPLHLIFNMIWLYSFSKQLEPRYRFWRYLLLVVLIAIPSNLAQFYIEGPSFGGMSGVVYGLFGYLWYKTRLAPEDGFFLAPNTVLIMMVWFVLCLFEVFGPVANTAHGMGLVMGGLLAYAHTQYRRVSRSGW